MGMSFCQRGPLSKVRNLLWLSLSLLSLLSATAHAETDSARVDRLFMWASDGNIRHREMVEPAKDSLGQMGAYAAPWLARKLTTSDARERLTLADVFEKIGLPATPFLLPYLDAPGEDTPRNAARCLERIKDTAAVMSLLAHMDHPEYSVRSQVATALGKTGDIRALGALSDHLRQDQDSDVRKSCAVALGGLEYGALGDKGATAAYESPLLAALRDSFFGVRQAAQQSLIKLGVQDPDLILVLIDDTSSTAQAQVARHSALVAMGGSDAYSVRRYLESLLKSDDFLIRGFAVEALGLSNSAKSVDPIAQLKKRETNPFVIAQIDRFERIARDTKK